MRYLVANLQTYFTNNQLGILVAVWIGSGIAYGIVMSVVISKHVGSSGSFRFYDCFSKVTLGFGFLGYIVIGICYLYQFTSFVLYIFLMIFIGIGSMGYYGFAFLSLT